ncbi:MAG: V-type ATP synthase subunit D [Desulfurococcales archaeon]|nr:V-type ATP synthase subunit D [Desulfurococcales archaeon]
MAVDPRKVLPTKINLIRLRREVKMIQRIRKVMEEKREVLLHYIKSAAEEYNRYQGEVFRSLDGMFRDYYVGVAAEGVERAWDYASVAPESLEVEVGTRVLFAVKTPTFRLVEGSASKPALPGSVHPRLPLAYREAYGLLPKLLKMLEYEEALALLIDELRETQRLINAMDYVIIPSYERAIKFIKSVLDERMREDFIRLKMLKKKLEERGASIQTGRPEQEAQAPPAG